MSMPNIQQLQTFLMTLQDQICDALAQEDGEKTFNHDQWQYPSGQGGGITRILEDGPLIEKGGVNFSHVQGATLPKSASAFRPQLANRQFEALGVSLIIHPRNPFIPTTHANFRFIVAKKDNSDPIWWFGGGYDLTPYYGFDEDCIHWHKTAKQACQPFGETVYPRFKKWCDDYFYLKHRQEPRGIGGLFFDDLDNKDINDSQALWQSIANSFLPAYLPIVQKRKSLDYTPSQREFQLYRRGRYVEFNLIYDRGTLFGLQSNGRTESILASMPPLVSWRYDWQPPAHTAEAELYEHFLQPKDWANLNIGSTVDE